MTAILLIAIFMISTCAILPTFAATEEDIEASIALGVPWLAAQQNTDGSWGEWHNIAKTGLAVLKFIDYVKEIPDIDSWTDPDYIYHDVVVDGLDFIFSEGHYVDISVQTHGDPDTLDNDQGIRFYGFDDYETSIALMALGATMTPSLTVNTPGLPLDGVTYADVVQDIVDYLSYKQRENTNVRGGWGYEGDPDSADNSVSGYASLGLGYAQAFGATIPQFVLDELNIWINYIQNDVNEDPFDGGSGYNHPDSWVNMLKTGNLLYQMALFGDTNNTQRVIDAIDYQERHWNEANWDPGWKGPGWAGDWAEYQTTFCIMKGFEAFGIDLIDLDDDSIPEYDWFDDISTRIVDTQNPDGSWNQTNWGDDLSTTWALLTLEKTVAIPVISVSVDIKPSSWPNPINKDKNGVTSIAICGTEDFDVTTIDPITVMLHNETSEVGVSPLRWSYEDVATPYTANPDDPEGHDENGDGYVDLVLKYKTPEYVETLELCEIPDWEYIKLYLKGNLIDDEGGTPIEGFDWVRIQSSKGKGKNKP